MSSTTSDEKGRSAAHVLLALVGKLVGLVAALVVVGALLVVIVLPRAVHGQAMTVLTGSMEPAIPTGSLAVVRPVDPRTVAVGDVVTYQVRPGEEVYVTHRVIEVDQRRGQTVFVLQGDANNVADDPILGDRIRGEVWFSVPVLGTARDALTGRGGLYLVATLLLAWFACAQISAGLRDRRTQRRGTGDPSVVVLDRPLALVHLDGRVLNDLDLSVTDVAARCQGLVVSTDVLLVTGEPGSDAVGVAGELAWLRPRRVRLVEAGTTLGLPHGAEVAVPEPAGGQRA